MKIVMWLCYGIDMISEWLGKIAAWLIAVEVVIISYDVMMRYLFNAPTIWSNVLSYLLGATFVFLGLAYVWYHDKNVRIDMFYNRLTVKWKLIFNTTFTIACFIPLVFFITRAFGQETINSYQAQERVWMAAWYPLLWPFKLAATVGFGLLFLQGLSSTVRNIVTYRTTGEIEGL